jgi:predicted dienelactone hydrolase
MPVAEQPPAGLRPDAPPYAVHGPYAVGAREFEIDEGDYTVYTALNAAKTAEEITYSANGSALVAAFVTTPPSPLTTHGRAINAAEPDTAHGPYPLVILSIGLAGWRHAYSFLAKHLASYGFVVMAWDPRGETLEEFWAGAATRPLDTNRLIAYADTLTAPDGELAGLNDTEHIASTGHSSGGWSALASGGAQMDFDWCAAHPDLVEEGSDCSQFPGYQEEIAAMLGLASVPEGLWPPTNDPRVKAIVALAPDGDIWGAEYEGVAVVQVPTLVMAGSKDRVNIPEQTAYPIYEHLGSAAKSLVIFEGGSHIIFINQCRDMPWMVQDAYWFCADAVWDMDRVHDLINHVVTAFLLDTLKGDADAHAALLPDAVNFAGIEYTTTLQ